MNTTASKFVQRHWIKIAIFASLVWMLSGIGKYFDGSPPSN